MVFRESTADVKESGVYNVNVAAIALTPDHLLIYPHDGDKARHLLAIEKTARMNSLGNYISVGVLPDNYVEIIPFPTAMPPTG